MVASLSRPANPYDNAVCESFMKTLKQEEIDCHQYRDLAEGSGCLEEFSGNYYNRQRLHSALGYRTPEEFERDNARAAAAEAPYDAATREYFHPPHRPSGRPGSPAPLDGGSA